MKTTTFASLLLAGTALGSPAQQKRDSVTAQVNFANNTGKPQHLASGILYGLPDTPNQIPTKFYTDMGFNYNRAGGAQVPAPGRGWIWGLNEYKKKKRRTFPDNDTEPFCVRALQLQNLPPARRKIHLFDPRSLGADGTQNSSASYPGDNGDWTSWDNYLTHLLSDIKANGMTDGLIIDIWNEPDLTYFWNRDQTQYLQMWGRTFHRLRSELAGVELSGPASAGEPLPSNNWWKNWASFAATNKSIPDQYAWHMEGGGGDLLSAQAGLVYWQKTYGLPGRPININEYAVLDEQVPAGTAWWIGQLERVNAVGLRGNWLSGWKLHDLLASLLSKPNADNSNYDPKGTGYFPNGDYQVYKYYNLNMTGHRVGTLPSSDLKLDAYATVGDDRVARVLVGVRIAKGTWQLQLNKLSALGLPTSGTLNVHTWGFPVASNVHYGQVDGPKDLGWYGHAYSGTR
ncbi:glycoside hydrolase family 39 protein [Aspergillus novofumigatus IBT 16806]|uniref:Glycoside hydrolase n=1 Tax=Aspergillus novofumigatus (strain IBT 16806) TaxID=1392255 RepID=A0A2I1CEH4_ASPN1|nr:glycoside hydrolase [Aspergillus novofumigatus IBT 16806]PKX96013.1 glycoside hydrolase [Aspergillus novofumigatus IBT 16806]